MRRIRQAVQAAAVLLLLLTPVSAYAESTAAATPAPGKTGTAKEQPSHPHHRQGFRAGGHFIVSETAKLLDMNKNDLVASLQGGKTLYELAKEKKGWTEDQYIQKLSAAASVKLDESLQEGVLTADEVTRLKAGLPALLKLSLHNAAQHHTGDKAKPRT